jgi:3'(2'), 5'-bisphosphate nucleotidase
MQASEFRRLAEGLLGPVLAAGRVQMRHFGAGVAVETKADRSPVTVADRESEALILEALAQLAPDIPVIAEEEVTAGRVPAIGASFFLVDPLDGTKGFVKGRPNFTIKIGLIEQRQPTFGLIYAPALHDFYVTLGTAEAVNTPLAPDAPERRLNDCGLTRIRTRVPDPDALRALVSHSHLTKATTRLLESYGVAETRALASSLKFGLLAKGEADLYARAGPTSEWDTAAGHAILSAAGGSVTRVDGTPLLYGNAAKNFENPDFIAWARTPLPKRR